MKVIVIGAGLGGLACAIACRREGLAVLLVERAAEILPIGSGIQVSSNASRVAGRLEILPALMNKAIQPEALQVRRYDNGKILHVRQGRDKMVAKYGSPWFVIHRADYHEVMLDEAKRLGVEIRLGCNVESLDFGHTEVVLDHGERLNADVIVGADGLWSTTRETLLERPSPPHETGDLAYRATLTRQQMLELDEPRATEWCGREVVNVWFGPEKHCIIYPIRGGETFNMVLTRPDDLPAGVRTAQGSLEEMRKSFEGWDYLLTKMLSKVDSVLKWKLCHHEELEKWVRGSVVLLGDACHPTLPYQGQGAAMAVEDGATLGRLLGLLNSHQKPLGSSIENTREILNLYETLRKSRTTMNVRGAAENKFWYHLSDGPMQERRDRALAGTSDDTDWCWVKETYSRELLGFDAVEDGEQAFYSWLEQKSLAPWGRSQSHST
ncbi:putative salicylate hydroxylase [Exophiala viscosa]|uniref:putative salicylate hydroxylase n=1 Tax=Exophiala viscosa TaxID=2486360 RepID=UPI00219E3C2C|nr:putative salicylate hydroxylase [Exophiala viscosa]